jgi:tRNA (guanine10-N2)-methyltransferase
LEDATQAAKDLVSRSILVQKIYELWGSGVDYETLHADIRTRSEHLWPAYQAATFRFEFDLFRGTHSNEEKRRLIESFAFMEFTGKIVMSKPDNQFIVFEDYELDAAKPHLLHFGREVAEGGRRAVNKYNVKKRHYIATTSMDAELSLVTANMALSAPGTLAYDPFMGTGSFPVSCAHFGAAVFGSDLDGRSIRGKKGRNVASNFKQYGTSDLYLGGVTADLTNSPVLAGRILDAIVCDPPYGVREGLKVLGHVKERLKYEVILDNGIAAHLQDDYVPPKKPYSFVRMLDDILDFSAIRLVDGGRLCMWMPVAGAKEDPDAAPEDLEKQAKEDPPEAEEYAIPQHPALELVVESKQHFNKCKYGRERVALPSSFLSTIQYRREIPMLTILHRVSSPHHIQTSERCRYLRRCPRGIRRAAVAVAGGSPDGEFGYCQRTERFPKEGMESPSPKCVLYCGSRTDC